PASIGRSSPTRRPPRRRHPRRTTVRRSERLGSVGMDRAGGFVSGRVKALLAAVLIAGAACSHRVSINSNPPGARTYVDNQFIGVTPTTFLEHSGIGKEYQIRLEKDGYRTYSTQEKQRLNPIFL